MDTNPLVEIFCDGNEQIGFGHIRRSTTLAEQLINDGFNVRITGLSDKARDLLPLPSHFGEKAQIVIFDSHAGIDNNLQEANRLGQITITLDWFGETVPDINIVVYPHRKVYAKIASFTGFDYILIRKEIASLRMTNEVKDKGNIIVCIGGSDLLDQGQKAAHKLSRQNLNVTLIQGPLSNRKNISSDFRYYYNPSIFSTLLAECSWTVTNGGGCFFEALCLGKAAFILPQTTMEQNIARYAFDKGAVLGIGMQNLRKFNSKEIMDKEERGILLVDGQGSKRISSIIKNLL